MHHSLDMSLEAFCTWLCQREHEVVGRPGTCFHSPLALWLSERFGHVYGVDDNMYGRALHDPCVWRLLPRWAVAFVARTEARSLQVLTGQEAFALLADVERMLLLGGRRSQVADCSMA